MLSHLNLQASNIRNIHLPDQVYPPSFHLDTAIFGTGNGTVDGTANSLAERIKDGEISRYLKPFFRGMKVYDKLKDKEKGLFPKLYEMLVGGVAKLLENRLRQEVATKADISGLVEKSQTSTLQIILEVIKNALIKAILPTCEREVSGAVKHKSDTVLPRCRYGSAVQGPIDK